MPEAPQPGLSVKNKRISAGAAGTFVAVIFVYCVELIVRLAAHVPDFAIPSTVSMALAGLCTIIASALIPDEIEEE